MTKLWLVCRPDRDVPPGSTTRELSLTVVSPGCDLKLHVINETDAEGNTIERERRTTVNHAMKSCRRVWNVAARRNPGKLPRVTP